MSVAIVTALNGAADSRSLVNNATLTQTIADTNETDLFNVPIPAGTLKGTRGVRLTAWGRFAANANVKTVRVRFGAGDIYVVVSGSVNGGTWFASFIVLRRGVNSQIRIGQGGFAASLATALSSTAAENEDNDIALRVTGQNGTASAGDIALDGCQVEIL